MINFIVKFLVLTFLTSIVGCSSMPLGEQDEVAKAPECYFVMPVYDSSQNSFVLVNIEETPPTLR